MFVSSSESSSLREGSVGTDKLLELPSGEGLALSLVEVEARENLELMLSREGLVLLLLSPEGLALSVEAEARENLELVK